MNDGMITLAIDLPVRALNAGLFISRGVGKHPERTIDSYEVICVKSGTLGIYEDDREYEVHAGEALLLHPHRKHGGTFPYAADLSFYWIHFHLLKHQSPAENPGIELPQHVRLADPDRMIEQFRRFLDDQEQGRRSSVMPNLIMLELLCAMADSRHANERLVQPNAIAQRADSLLRTRFHEPLSTAVVAEALGCNPDYLGRAYRRVYARSITDALHDYRLRYACQQLMDGNENVNEIARKAGYDDPGYFRRMFKRHKGVSPSKYKRKYALVHINTE